MFKNGSPSGHVGTLLCKEPFTLTLNYNTDRSTILSMIEAYARDLVLLYSATKRPY